MFLCSFNSIDAIAYFGAYFGRSAGPYNLDDVHCNGDESTLLECLQSGPGFHNCIPGKDAGVKCNRMLMSVHNSFVA